MIRRVLERTQRASALSRVIVATDDRRIYEAVAPYGEVVMTDPSHESGSDRVAEVVRTIDCEIVVNVQGDLPLLEPALVDALVAMLVEQPELGMATLAVPIRSREELEDESVVKVVCDGEGRALYFSRAAVPFDRDAPGSFAHAWHHVGLYAYRRQTLLDFSALAPSTLERIEKLEQLRALENGIRIGVLRRDDPPPLEVDTSADLERVRSAIAVS